MNTEHLPERLNWKQACELLGCCKSHFYNLLQAKKIPYVKIGKRKGIKVMRRDIEQFISGLNNENII